jgi:transcriptional regulator with XRE-family HTH domain
MDKLVERIRKDLQDKEARYVYADTIVNAFVAAQIKGLREERGLSQDQLATLIGTQQSGISRLEKADYSAWKVETLRKLAKALGVRLRIRFEEFNTLLDEIKGFDDKNLLPRRFEDDPVFALKSATNRRNHRRSRVRSKRDQTELPVRPPRMPAANEEGLTNLVVMNPQPPAPINQPLPKQPHGVASFG